jgi:hypothetical protein
MSFLFFVTDVRITLTYHIHDLILITASNPTKLRECSHGTYPIYQIHTNNNNNNNNSSMMTTPSTIQSV